MSDSIRKQHFILLRRLNRPVITLLLTGAVYAVFIGLRLGLHGFDPSFFITAGDRFCNAELVPEKIIILKTQPVMMANSITGSH